LLSKVIRFESVIVGILSALCHVSVMFAYEQCLLVLGYHPDVWIEAANYLEHSSQILTEKGVRLTDHMCVCVSVG